MKEAKETHISNKMVGRMFPQGIEAKEIWYRGDCIFKLSTGEMVQIEYDRSKYLIYDLFKLGDYIVGYNYFTYNAASEIVIPIFKDGQYVDDLKICDVPSGYEGYGQHSYLFIPYFEQGIILVLEQLVDYGITRYNRIFSITKNGVYGINVPNEYNTYCPGIYPNQGIFTGNSLFIGCKYYCGSKNNETTMEEWMHSVNYITSLSFTADWIPVGFNFSKRYGVDLDVDIDTTKPGRYELNNPIPLTMIPDVGYNRCYAQCVTALLYEKFPTQFNPDAVRRVFELRYCEIELLPNNTFLVSVLRESDNVYYNNGVGRIGTSVRKIGNYYAWYSITNSISTEYSDFEEEYYVVTRNLEALARRYLDPDVSEDDYYFYKQCLVNTFSPYLSYDKSRKMYYGFYDSGASQTRNPDDQSKMFWDQDPDWEVLEDSDSLSHENGFNAMQSNSDGLYACNGSNLYYLNLESEVDELNEEI